MAEMKHDANGELLCEETCSERKELIDMALGLSEEEVQRVIALARQLLAPQ